MSYVKLSQRHRVNISLLQQVPLLLKPTKFSGAGVAFIRRVVLVLCGVLGQG